MRDAELKDMQWGKFSLKFDRTLVMGIINITPDSFSDGGLYLESEDAIDHAKKLVEDGADIIDIGGESTRPFSDAVSVDEELKRVLLAIKLLSKSIDAPISIDTYKPQVAEECIKNGAAMINDIYGLRNREMMEVAKRYNVPAIIMHMKGEPKSMQQNPIYGDAVIEIKNFLQSRVNEARKFGIKNLIIDPGIGFGKLLQHNLEILKRLSEFEDIGCPILIGTSRKSFIGSITGLCAKERFEGTIASVCASIINGANIIRVHDVKECKRAALVIDAIKNA